MALDTAAKRWAVPGVGRPWMRSNLPNTAKDEAWRPGAGNAYPVATFSTGGGQSNAPRYFARTQSGQA